MATYNLTARQKDVLRKLVEGVQSGQAEEPLILSTDIMGVDIIGLGRFDHSVEGDLDALCEADLLTFRFNGQGDKVFTIKQSGYDAIENNFIAPESSPSAQINIGAIVHEMRNGNIQSAGFVSQSELQQIVNDTTLLKEKIDDLTNQLLDAIKTEIPADKLVAYIKSVEELKQHLDAEETSPSILERLFRALSFMGDIEGTISLMTRAWPYVYPLLVIASEKIKAAGL